jgi:uncharacterized protein (TIGR03435 family)
MPVYRLTVAKGGPKLAKAREQDANHRWSTRAGLGSLLMNGASMPEFAGWLSAQLNQPIVESTGLTGRYDLKLEWVQEDDGRAQDADTSPEMKLEPTKGPVEVLIIDRMERASAN